MSIKLKNIPNNDISKEISSLYEDDIENDNDDDDEKINIIKNNNFISNIASQNKPNRANGDIDEVDKVDFNSSTKRENNNIINNNIQNYENNNEKINYQNNNENNYEEENINNEEVYDDNKNNNKINETQFYELNTNKIVDIMKNDYDEIFISQNKDIAVFVDKLAKENSSLKIEINKLKSEISKLKTQNEFYKKSLTNKNETNSNINEKDINNKQIELNLEIHEKEKENIKNEYESILVNNPSPLILKDIKSLYEKLIRCKDDLYNQQKINILLQEEIDKIKEENEYIKSNIEEEKNQIIEKIIEIQAKTNSEIEINKNLLFNNNDNLSNKNNLIIPNNNNNQNEVENSNNNDNNNIINSNNSYNNNPYLFNIEKIKNLTYEKNKLLSCNYDFFIKINDLSQNIEEKNNIINNQVQKIRNLEAQISNIKFGT